MNIYKSSYICDEIPKTHDLTGCPDEVIGYFQCQRTKLTSLKGCPQIIGTNFYCRENFLPNLIGGPAVVNGYYECNDNLLTSLEGTSCIVGKYFDCRNNRLKDLMGVNKFIKQCEAFCCSTKVIKSNILGLLLIKNLKEIALGWGEHSTPFAILNKYAGQGKPGVLQAQRDLIDAGFEEYAEL